MIASTFDEPAADMFKLEMVIESKPCRAQKDVAVLLDSITRLARLQYGYSFVWRVLTGGVDRTHHKQNVSLVLLVM